MNHRLELILAILGIYAVLAGMVWITMKVDDRFGEPWGFAAMMIMAIIVSVLACT